MIELRRFQLPLATRKSNAFDFERASLTLMAKHQHHGAVVVRAAKASVWLDPAPPRSKTDVQQGVNHHG